MPPELDKSNSDPAVGMAEFDALRELVNALTSRTDTNGGYLATNSVHRKLGLTLHLLMTTLVCQQ